MSRSARIGRTSSRWYSAGSIRGAAFSLAAGVPAAIALVEARNAIVHGLGALTKRQVRGAGCAALVAELTALGIAVDRTYKLTVSEEAVKDAALACRAFISSLDLELANVSI